MGIQSVFLGDRHQNKSGAWFEVTKYVTGKKIHVTFDGSGYECVVEGQEIRRGCIVDSIDKYPSKGQLFPTTSCGMVEVVKYTNAEHVEVVFPATGYRTTVEACQLRRGNVKDFLVISVAKVGFLGGMEHTSVDKFGETTWAYQKWINMLERCYDPYDELAAAIYKGVTVDKEWHNFQNFAPWAIAQVGYGNRGWATEKDLLVKGNKFYSPSTCCFLPQELNNQLLKAGKMRGDYPIGVALHRSNGKFVAYVSGKYAGIFATPEEAFYGYKEAKELRLKTLANKWRDQIDPRAYQALMNYEVSITD